MNPFAAMELVEAFERVALANFDRKAMEPRHQIAIETKYLKTRKRLMKMLCQNKP